MAKKNLRGRVTETCDSGAACVVEDEDGGRWLAVEDACDGVLLLVAGRGPRDYPGRPRLAIWWWGMEETDGTIVLAPQGYTVITPPGVIWVATRSGWIRGHGASPVQDEPDPAA